MADRGLYTEGDRDVMASLVVGARRVYALFLHDGKKIEGVKAEMQITLYRDVGKG